MNVAAAIVLLSAAPLTLQRGVPPPVRVVGPTYEGAIISATREALRRVADQRAGVKPSTTMTNLSHTLIGEFIRHLVAPWR